MDAAAEAKGERYTLEEARVYLHVVQVGTERIVHLDIDHPDLNEILPPKEACYAGGRDGGIFVGLRAPQVERAEQYLRDRVPD